MEYGIRSEIKNLATQGYTLVQSDTSVNNSEFHSKILHLHYNEIDSTQLEARRVAPKIDNNIWYLCTASKQTRGIGQRERSWYSSSGVDVYATYGFVLEQDEHKKVMCLPLIAVLSVLQTLECFGIEANFKWVNDAMFCGRKISGILVESTGNRVKTASGKTYPVFLVGIGINVNLEKNISKDTSQDTSKVMSSKDIAPQDMLSKDISQKGTLIPINQPYTSMLEILNKYTAVEEVINKLTGHLYQNVTELLPNGFNFFKSSLEDKLERFQNQAIIFDKECSTKQRYIIGKIFGLSNDYGQLLVKDFFDQEFKFSNGRILRGYNIEPALKLNEVLDSLVRLHKCSMLDLKKYAKNNFEAMDDGFWHAIWTEQKIFNISEVPDIAKSQPIICESYDNSSTDIISDISSIFVTYIAPHYGDITKEELSRILSLSIQNTLGHFNCNTKIESSKRNQSTMDRLKINKSKVRKCTVTNSEVHQLHDVIEQANYLICYANNNDQHGKKIAGSTVEIKEYVKDCKHLSKKYPNNVKSNSQRAKEHKKSKVMVLNVEININQLKNHFEEIEQTCNTSLRLVTGRMQNVMNVYYELTRQIYYNLHIRSLHAGIIL